MSHQNKKNSARNALAVGNATGGSVHFKQKFNYSTTFSVGVGVVSFNLLPNNFGPRLTTISDNFDFYRCTGMKITMHPYQSITGGVFTDNAVVVGFVPGILGANPTVYADIVEMQHVCIISSNCSVPRTLSLDRKELRDSNQVAWFHTRAPSVVDPNLYTQGLLFLAGLAATTAPNRMVLEFTQEYEFSGPVWSGLTYSPSGAKPSCDDVKSVREPDEKQTSEDDWEEAETQGIPVTPSQMMQVHKAALRNLPPGIRSGKTPAYTGPTDRA